MFEVEKPRKFHYEPRFYDPEKDRWEARKKRYAIEQERKENQQDSLFEEEKGDALEYFEQRVAALNRAKRQQSAKLTWKDFFRKREMPKFEYHSRLHTQPTSGIEEATATCDAERLREKYQRPHRIKIRRRFDISDTDYMKPISGTKIMLYCFIVFLLVTLILKF